MSVWWTVCFVTTACAETLLALTPAPVLKDLSSNPTLRRAKVSAHTRTFFLTHKHTQVFVVPHTRMCFVLFSNDEDHYEVTLLPDALHSVSSKHVAHGKTHACTHTYALCLWLLNDDVFLSVSRPWPQVCVCTCFRYQRMSLQPMHQWRVSQRGRVLPLRLHTRQQAGLHQHHLRG